jgi:predicted nucleic acid-binding protein
VITAVDTNVLVDVFNADVEFGLSSSRMLRRCLAEGALIACDTVWAETAACFGEGADANEALAKLRIVFSPIELSSASAAGEGWRAYRQAGGTRERLAPNFLIGAHALNQADRLLTRDRGFYRKYFSELTVLDPAELSPYPSMAA